MKSQILIAISVVFMSCKISDQSRKVNIYGKWETSSGILSDHACKIEIEFDRSNLYSSIKSVNYLSPDSLRCTNSYSYVNSGRFDVIGDSIRLTPDSMFAWVPCGWDFCLQTLKNDSVQFMHGITNLSEGELILDSGKFIDFAVDYELVHEKMDRLLNN